MQHETTVAFDDGHGEIEPVKVHAQPEIVDMHTLEAELDTACKLLTGCRYPRQERRGAWSTSMTTATSWTDAHPSIPTK